MPASAPTLSVLREPCWSALHAALDRAVRDGRTVPAAREVLLRPVDLLETMAGAAGAALGDDVPAAERLRLLLQLASPFRAVVAQTHRPQGGERKQAPARRTGDARAYEPGLLDHGALAVIALAAVRVTRADDALDVVHGLALAAAPAEALGRLPRLPTAAELSTILGTLYLLDAVGTALRTPFLRPLAADPAERARWAALDDLFGQTVPGALAAARRALDLGRTAPLPWDGATAEPVEAVRPSRPGGGEEVVLEGRFEQVAKGGHLLPGVRVVLASEHGVQAAAAAGGTARELRVTLPSGAGPGWIGFSLDEAIALSNRFRIALRRALASAGPLAVPTTAIPLLDRPDPDRPGERLAAPARSATNRFDGPTPRIARVEVQPSPAAPGATVTISWASAGATAVRLDPMGLRLPATGRTTLVAPAAGELVLTVVPLAAGDGVEETGAPVRVATAIAVRPRILSLEVTQAGQTSPLWLGGDLQVAARIEGAAGAGAPILSVEPGPRTPIVLEAGEDLIHRGVIPADAVAPGLRLALTLPRAGGEGTWDTRRAGPLEVRPRRAVTVVLVRPQVVDASPREVTRAAAPAELPAARPPKIPDAWLPDDTRVRARLQAAAKLGLRFSGAPRVTGTEACDPEVIPAVDLDRARAALDAATKRVGLSVDVEEPPFVDDALAALLGPVCDADDPRLPVLLEQLDRRALLTPGFEAAAWVCLVPTPGEESDALDRAAHGPAQAPLRPAGLFRSAPGVAAHRVAVCDLAGLPALARALAEVPAPVRELSVTAGRRPRLRLLGTLDDRLRIERVQQEDRAAGPGGPVETALVAVTLDCADRELSRTPLTAHRADAPRSIAALIPVPDVVAAIELRCGARVERRLTRTARAPEVGEAHLTATPWSNEAQHLSWEYEGPRPLVSLALVRDGVRTDVEGLASCDRAPPIRLTRYRAADAVELWASDGWLPAYREVAAGPGAQDPLRLENPNPVLIRRIAPDRYFADVPPGWTARWTAEGISGMKGRLLRLSPEARGALVLEATGAAGVVRDRITVGGDVP